MSDIFTQASPQTDSVQETLEELLEERQLIVYNDEVNTFDHVIESLVAICNHTEIQAEQCSLIIHFKGKGTVREGDFRELHPMKTQLCDRGLDAVIE